MFRERKQYDIQGREIIKGNAILELLPKEIMPYLHKSCNDKGLVWENIVQDCTMYIDSSEHCSIMYKVGKWSFSGKLLITFNLCPKCNYRVSYPNKWMNLEHTIGDMRYCY
ncbi:MAG: hypothetical protein AAF348_07425 [Bacteroidota bacterium]